MVPLRPRAVLLGVVMLLVARAANAEPPASDAPASPPRVVVAVDKEERARQALTLHDEAWALYEEGHYHAAIERLEAALRVDPDGRELVYNLGLLHEKLAELKTAEAYYRRYLDMEPDPKAKARAQATLRRIEGARREVAGPPLLVAAAGPRVDEGPRRSPPRTSPDRRIPTVVATGVAVAAFTTGAACGMSAVLKNPGSGATTGQGVTISSLQSDAHTAHTEAVIADVSFILSAAATATALFLHFTSPARTAAAQRSSFVMTAATSWTPSRGAVRVTF